MRGLLLLLVGLLISTANFGQSIISLDSCYKGGASAFYEHLTNTLDYPNKDKAKGIVGTEIIRFEVSKFGEVVNVYVLNSLSKKIDANLTESILATAGQWLVKHSHSLVLPVIYQLEQNSFSYVPFPKDYLNIGTKQTKASLSSDKSEYLQYASIVKPDAYHMELGQKYMDSGEYKLAIKQLDELIRRDPLNKDHRATRIFCHLKMRKEKKANRDLAFLTGMIKADMANDIMDETLTSNDSEAMNLIDYEFFF